MCSNLQTLNSNQDQMPQINNREPLQTTNDLEYRASLHMSICIKICAREGGVLHMIGNKPYEMS